MGSREFTVLSAMRSRTERHGLDLLGNTGLPSGALYPTLVRLERTGLIRSRWTGTGRRGYLLTPDGVTALRAGPRVADRAGPGARIRWLPVLVIAMVESSLALSRRADDRLSDLGVYLGAVDGLRHGTSLYDFMSANGAPFTYPPFAGLIFWPLALGPVSTVRLGWTCVTVATVVALSILLARGAAPPWRRRAPVIAAVLLLSAPVSSDLRFGQVSVGLAALVAVDVLGLRRSRFHGILIGVAAAVKLTPLIFVPMLWGAGRPTAAIMAGRTFVACGVLAGVVLPADSWRFWGREMWRVGRLGHITSVGNQSFNGALMRLGVDGPTRSLAVLAVAGSVAAVAFWRAARLSRGGDRLSAMTIVGAAGIVVSPVSWTHHQLWLVLGALLPVPGPRWARCLWSAAVLGIVLLPVTALGPPLWSNARMLTAIVIACLVPLRTSPTVDIAGPDGTGLDSAIHTLNSSRRVHHLRSAGAARTTGTPRL
jgi:alpha-1,2-mannosyltransferase